MALRMYDVIVKGATTVVCSSAKYRGLISATCGSIYRYVRAGIQHYSDVYTYTLLGYYWFHDAQ